MKNREKPVPKRMLCLLVALVLLLSGCEIAEDILREVEDALYEVEQGEGYSTFQADDGDLIVQFIDVGQADSILLSQNERYMLIDGGDVATRDELVAFLTESGVQTLDYVIATHPHADHIGGLDGVVAAFSIGKFYMPKAIATTKVFERLTTELENKGLKITTPVAGQKFTFEDVQFTILAPNAESYNDMNNYSIVLLAEYGDTRFLFTGDAETESEQEILDNFWNIEADVLKLGHHGSTTSTSDAFLAAVSPEIAIISCGRDNSYGHPHKEIVTKLEKNSIPYYRTDTEGTITIISDGATLSVQP